MTARRAGSTDGLALLCWDTVVGRFENFIPLLIFPESCKVFVYTFAQCCASRSATPKKSVKSSVLPIFCVKKTDSDGSNALQLPKVLAALANLYLPPFFLRLSQFLQRIMMDAQRQTAVVKYKITIL
jgi:hypothetical protein